MISFIIFLVNYQINALLGTIIRHQDAKRANCRPLLLSTSLCRLYIISFTLTTNFYGRIYEVAVGLMYKASFVPCRIRVYAGYVSIFLMQYVFWMTPVLFKYTIWRLYRYDLKCLNACFLPFRYNRLLYLFAVFKLSVNEIATCLLRSVVLHAKKWNSLSLYHGFL